uniref:Venom serine protease 34 n=1 Tax=Ceratitis capitata TaxID=7213 RepID=W8BSF9_CERCA
MERRSFLNRAVISYISAGPPRRLASVGVKGVTVSSTTSTTANTQNYQNKNKKKKKHKNKHKKPSTIQISSETSADISNPFTYLTTLLSNTIETSVFIAPATQQTQKHTKPKDNRGKLTKPTRRGSTAGSNDLLTFSPEPLNIYNGRNASISIPATTLTTITLTKNVSTEDFKPTSSINEPLVSRDYRILSNPQNYAGYPAGAGNGRFSCLVESVASQCDCGWSPHTLKVVSPSSAAGLNEYSSMAGVLTIDYGKIFCGAVIIHHRYLLSAAHCFISAATNSSDLLQVVVGEHDLSTVLESVYTHYYRVNAIILHEQFRATFNQVRNDIALLRTSQAMVWNRGVAPACLPFHSITGTSGGLKPPIVGQLVETAGWGSISFGGPQSSLLLSAQLDVIGVEECRRWLGALPPATFCTYTPGRDTCQYDSGGGLYMREGGRLFVVGIVSYGYGCAARRPSVNTKVASYMRWIKSKTESVTYCVK